MKSILVGAVGGFTATVPMTMAMDSIWEHLPPEQQYSVHPSIITQRVLGAVGIEQHLSNNQHRVAALCSHFGYGTAMGAGYGLLGRHLPLPTVLRGVVYGLAVYAFGYHGYLPALGILRPVREHPRGRRALVLAAHVVWGVATALVTRGIEQQDGTYAQEPNRGAL